MTIILVHHCNWAFSNMYELESDSLRHVSFYYTRRDDLFDPPAIWNSYRRNCRFVSSFRQAFKLDGWLLIMVRIRRPSNKTS